MENSAVQGIALQRRLEGYYALRCVGTVYRMGAGTAEGVWNAGTKLNFSSTA